MIDAIPAPFEEYARYGKVCAMRDRRPDGDPSESSWMFLLAERNRPLSGNGAHLQRELGRLLGAREAYPTLHLTIQKFEPLSLEDSSRFWDPALYKPGGSQASFDKQFVRDYLTSTSWDKNSPPPELPPDIVEKTLARYQEALARITRNA